MGAFRRVAEKENKKITRYGQCLEPSDYLAYLNRWVSYPSKIYEVVKVIAEDNPGMVLLKGLVDSLFKPVKRMGLELGRHKYHGEDMKLI